MKGVAWVKRLVERFGLGNSQEFAFAGALPLESRLDTVLRQSRRFMPLEDSPVLSERLTAVKPKLLVVLIGIGSRSGFLIGAPDNGRQILPDSWWRVEACEINLFAFSCHSFEYLESSDARKFICSSLCYRGEVWVWLEAGEFWLDFVSRIQVLLRRFGGVNSRLYGEVVREYGEAIAGRGRWSVTQTDYMTQVSLVRQVQRLEQLTGGGL